MTLRRRHTAEEGTARSLRKHTPIRCTQLAKPVTLLSGVEFRIAKWRKKGRKLPLMWPWVFLGR